MEVSGQAIVLANGLFNTKSAKTAHGLIRASKRFEIVAVIDKKFYGKFVSIDTNQKITVTEKPSSITIHKPNQDIHHQRGLHNRKHHQDYQQVME